jgi:peptide/nickel transport system substrate-binding protein
MGTKNRYLVLLLIVCLSLFMIAGTLSAEVAPKSGGDYRTVYGQFPPHFNCAIQSGAAVMIAAAQIFVGLVEFDDQWQPVPYLAKSWTISDDGLTYTFYLQEGTVFHDDKPVTSEDVAFSIDVVKNNHPFGAPMFGAVSEVQTPDKYTVIIKLERPQPALMLSLVPVLTPILPKHVFGDGQDLRQHPANVQPIGSGPFKMVEFKPGESFTLERFDKFMRSGRPYLDRYIGIQIQDPTAAMAALRRGEIHGAGFNGGIRLSNIEAMKNDPGLHITRSGYEAIGAFAYIEFNLRKKPFDDIRVRKAIAHAIDMPFILDRLQRGMAQRATGPILPENNPFFSSDVAVYDLNLEKANKLLDEAGYPRKQDGTRFSFTLDWLPHVIDDNQVIAEYLKPQLNKVGIDVQLRRPSGFGPWIQMVASWQFEVTLNLVFSYPDPIIGVHRLFHSENIKNIPWSNTGGYSNPKVDQLLDQAAVELNLEKRKALYAEFQKIISEDLPIIFLHQPAYHTITHQALKGHWTSIWGIVGPVDGLWWTDGRAPQ